MLKKTIVAGAVVAALGSGLAQAQQPAAQPDPPASPLTANIGLYSQYIFRGMTQTNRRPAIQGGVDYAHPSGFYLGTWASNISWLKENASAPGIKSGTYADGGHVEIDFYGGYKMSLPADFTLDLGTLYYWYPGKLTPAASLAGAPKADTWEVYGGVGWKWLSAKLSYAIKDEVFANKDADGTWYLDLSANVPLGDFEKGLTGWTLMAHWGYQKYSGTDPRNPVVAGRRLDNDTLFSYKDLKLGLSYALPNDFTVGAYYTRAYDYSKFGYGGVNDCVPGIGCGAYPRDLGKSTGTIYVQKTF